MKSSISMALTAILALFTTVQASPNKLLKGNERRLRRLGNLRNTIDRDHKKNDDPTASPSLSPTESPTCEKKCKEDKEDDDHKPLVTFAPSPSPASSIEFAPTPAPAIASTTPEPTFTDDFTEATPSTAVSQETGESAANNGIGISVDVGGDSNTVDVNVVITQNGKPVTVDDAVAQDDFVVDDFVYDDEFGSMSASMSTSMSMGEEDDGGGPDYGPEEEFDDTTEPEAAATDATVDESPEFDDDFTAFFGDPNANKKVDGPPEKEDMV